MRKIFVPILTIILAAVILLGMYNGLLGIRKANEEKELQAKMETILPGSTTFAEEDYTGEDTNIKAVYKGETGYVVATETYGYAGNIAMLIGDIQIRGGSCVLYPQCTAGINADLRARSGNPLAIGVITVSGEHTHVNAHQRHVVGNIPSNAAQADRNLTGV